MFAGLPGMYAMGFKLHNMLSLKCIREGQNELERVISCTF